MGVFQLCALALGGLFVVLLLRQYHPVFAVLVSLALSVLLLWQAVSLLRGIQKTLGPLFALLQNEQYGVVLRVIGIGLVVQVTADLCGEAGQAALEGKVILLGKLLVLTAALPLVAQVLKTLSELLL